VADRYAVPPGTRTFRSTLDIFQVARPISEIKAGGTLRIVDASHFEVVYTLDNWQTVQTVRASRVGYPGSYADIAMPGPEAGGSDKVIFTMHWPESGEAAEHWLGHNVEAQVVAPDQPCKAPLGSKPTT
jgi:glucoamylase